MQNPLGSLYFVFPSLLLVLTFTYWITGYQFEECCKNIIYPSGIVIMRNGIM